MSTKQDVERAIGRPMLFEKTFTSENSFEAVGTAEQWLKDKGYFYGSMCGSEPIGIAYSHDTTYISKWCNLRGDAPKLKGALVSSDFRNGTITVLLDHNPDSENWPHDND